MDPCSALFFIQQLRMPALGFATAEVLCGERRPSFLLKVADCATFCHIKVSLASSKSNAFLCAEPESQKQQGCQGLSHQELVGK
jgi:hypothetical protein